MILELSKEKILTYRPETLSVDGSQSLIVIIANGMNWWVGKIYRKKELLQIEICIYKIDGAALIIETEIKARNAILIVT